MLGASSLWYIIVRRADPKFGSEKSNQNIKRSVFCTVVFVVLTNQGGQPWFIKALTTFKWAAIFYQGTHKHYIQDTCHLLQ